MADKITLTKGEQEAFDAVKFCLLRGSKPFDIDVMTLVRIIERRAVSG